MDTIEFKSFQKQKKVVESPYEKALRKAKERAKNKRVAPKVKRKAKKRVKLPSTRKLVTLADRNFSIFIRNRDKKCVLCGKVTNLTCGHLIKRGKKSVRWDELNCHCLCMGCNYKDNFDHDVYVLWFIKNYGELPYIDLVEKSRGIFKPSREFLNNIITKYAIPKG